MQLAGLGHGVPGRVSAFYPRALVSSFAPTRTESRGLPVFSSQFQTVKGHRSRPYGPKQVDPHRRPSKASLPAMGPGPPQGCLQGNPCGMASHGPELGASIRGPGWPRMLTALEEGTLIECGSQNVTAHHATICWEFHSTLWGRSKNPPSRARRRIPSAAS